MIKTERSQGQTLLEYLIVSTIMLLCTYVVIEVVRFLSFKTVLQTAVSFRANEIASLELDLLKKGILQEHISFQNVSDKKFLNDYASFIEKDIYHLETSKISYDTKNAQTSLLFLKRPYVKVSVDFAKRETSERAAGVYLKAQTCLPVLFSYFYAQNKKISIGKQVGKAEDNRNCLGQFTSSEHTPLFWFSLIASAFSPCPASTDIYQKGFPLPPTIRMVSADEMDFLNKKWGDFPFSALLEHGGVAYER